MVLMSSPELRLGEEEWLPDRSYPYSGFGLPKRLGEFVYSLVLLIIEHNCYFNISCISVG